MEIYLYTYIHIYLYIYSDIYIYLSIYLSIYVYISISSDLYLGLTQEGRDWLLVRGTSCAAANNNNRTQKWGQQIPLSIYLYISLYLYLVAIDRYISLRAQHFLRSCKHEMTQKWGYRHIHL